MKIITPNDKSRSIPFRIVCPTDSMNNGKLGGRPPIGIIPNVKDTPLKYFGTIKFSEEENLFISLFVADFENLLSVRGKINKLGFVDVVIHKPQQRETNSMFESLISEHDIQILSVSADSELVDEELISSSGHKIGGCPHLIRDNNNITETITELFEQNFVQILQVDFPGNKDDFVSGDWFFGDGIFNLFGKSPFEGDDWYWYWDM